MRSPYFSRNKNYRRSQAVLDHLGDAFRAGDLELLRHHLREYLKWGSTQRQARLFGISHRTLQRLATPNQEIKLGTVLKIVRFLNQEPPTQNSVWKALYEAQLETSTQ